MKTDDLIRALAEDTAVEASPARRTLPLLVPAVALSLLLVVVILKPRPDFATAVMSFIPAMRHVLSLALFGTAFLAALALARPEGRRQVWPIGLVLAAALALAAWAWATTAPEARVAALMGSSSSFCLIAIPLLAIFPTAALFLAFRSGATTRPVQSGALIGLAGGAFFQWLQLPGGLISGAMIAVGAAAIAGQPQRNSSAAARFSLSGASTPD